MCTINGKILFIRPFFQSYSVVYIMNKIKMNNRLKAILSGLVASNRTTSAEKTYKLISFLFVKYEQTSITMLVTRKVQSPVSIKLRIFQSMNPKGNNNNDVMIISL